MNAEMFDIDDALRFLIVNEGSDLHLKVPTRPIVRVHGEMTPIEGSEPLTPEDTERVLREILHGPEQARRSSTRRTRSTSPTSCAGLARFRVNAFRQRGYV